MIWLLGMTLSITIGTAFVLIIGDNAYGWSVYGIVAIYHYWWIRHHEDKYRDRDPKGYS